MDQVAPGFPIVLVYVALIIVLGAAVYGLVRVLRPPTSSDLSLSL